MLVAGGDGLIGRALLQRFESIGVPVHYTSRRKVPGPVNCIYLDLNQPSVINFEPAVLYICAGVTDLSLCEKFPLDTRRINVNATLDLATKCHTGGASIIYLSTHAVFDGSVPFASSTLPPRPITEYGRQKVSAEQGILALGDRTTVVRMPKVVSCNVPLFGRWLSCLGKGQVIKPFSDFSFSPISLRFLTTALTMDHLLGIVHLSGASQVTYAEFALLLAKAMGAPKHLVEPITAKEMGTQILFAPRYTTLDTGNIAPALSIKPQEIQSVVNDLIEEFSKSQDSAQPYPHQ